MLRKRKINFSDSDSDEDGISTVKRHKEDLGSDDDWTAESEEDKIVTGRGELYQRTIIRSSQANGAKNSVAGKNILLDSEQRLTKNLPDFSVILG